MYVHGKIDTYGATWMAKEVWISYRIMDIQPCVRSSKARTPPTSLLTFHVPCSHVSLNF